MYQYDISYRDTAVSNLVTGESGYGYNYEAVYSPSRAEFDLTAGQAELTVGAAGSLTFTVPATNPAYEALSGDTAGRLEILLTMSGLELFRGRISQIEKDWQNSLSVTCEGMLSYLSDEVHPPYGVFTGTVAEYLQAVIDNYNLHKAQERKALYLGTVTALSPDTRITAEGKDYMTSLESIRSTLVTRYGGYLRMRWEGDGTETGKYYLDWLDNYGTDATQPVSFGSNLLDLAQEIDLQDAPTVLLPLGAVAEGESQARLTVAQVNGGSVYVEDADSVQCRGVRVEIKIWDSVTDPAQLLALANEALFGTTALVRSLTVNAVDLVFAPGSDASAWRLGDRVEIQSPPHGVQEQMQLTQMRLDLLDPSNDAYTFGQLAGSYTGSVQSESRETAQQLGTLAAEKASIDQMTAAVSESEERVLAETVRISDGWKLYENDDGYGCRLEGWDTGTYNGETLISPSAYLDLGVQSVTTGAPQQFFATVYANGGIRLLGDVDVYGSLTAPVASEALESNHGSLDTSGTVLSKCGNWVFAALKGSAVAGIPAGATWYTLPASCRPATAFQQNIVLNNGGANVLVVGTDGTVKAVAALSSGDGLRQSLCFPAADGKTS